jgi:hypothetical protein
MNKNRVLTVQEMMKITQHKTHQQGILSKIEKCREKQ